MTTHTHTKMGHWDKITMISLAVFVVGLAGGMIRDALQAPVFIANILFVLVIVGLVMTFVAGSKAFGGLRIGLATLITGFVFLLIGWIMVESAGTMRLLGGQITDFNDPLYIIGMPLRTFGVIFIPVGLVMSIVAYLRRMLRAVEGRAA